jgi:anti-anti-sigma factor
MANDPESHPLVAPRPVTPDVQRLIDRAMRVKVVRHNARLSVCRVAGEIDLLTVPTLGRVLDDLHGHRVPVVIVDLTGVRYCAAAGVRLLVDATGRALTAGRRLAVVIASLPVARVLTATDTADRIEAYTNLSEAMLALTT